MLIISLEIMHEIGSHSYNSHYFHVLLVFSTGPEVIKLFMLNSTEQEIKLLIKTNIPKNEEVSCFKSLRCGIYHANEC